MAKDIIDFHNVCDYFTAVCEAAKKHSPVEQKNPQGTNRFNTWIGYVCGTKWFRLALHSVKAIQKPLRPYLLTTEQRDEVARRISEDPKGVLQELKSSGGWKQPDPSIVMFMAMAAVCGPKDPKDNPMQKDLKEMMEGDPPAKEENK